MSSFFYGHNLFNLNNPVPEPVEKETIFNPNPKKLPISGRIELQNSDPVHHWSVRQRRWYTVFAHVMLHFGV